MLEILTGSYYLVLAFVVGWSCRIWHVEKNLSDACGYFLGMAFLASAFYWGLRIGAFVVSHLRWVG